MMVSTIEEKEVFNSESDQVYEQATDDLSFTETTRIPEEALQTVEIEKTANGFGFNIVGGIDNPHFAGDIGIYVSSVNPEAKSYQVVRTGDKILSFDGIDMTCKSHDEVVDVFRSVQVGHVAKMLIDREYLILQEERTQSVTTPTASMTTSATPTSKTTPKQLTNSESRGRLSSHGISAVIERIRGKVYEEEDAQSVTSYAPSTHSIIDDVPRTPRKPFGILDPRSNSWASEMLFVSIGLGALTLSGYLAYRLIRGRK